MRVKNIFLLVFLFFITNTYFTLNAQVVQPVKWSFSHIEKGDNQYELQFKALIDEGWSIYGSDIPSGGPVPTTIEFDETEGVEFIGEIISPELSTKYDPNFEMELTMGKGQLIFKQIVEVKSQNPVTITGELVYMSCDDTQCLPPDYIDFEFKLPGKQVEKDKPLSW